MKKFLTILLIMIMAALANAAIDMHFEVDGVGPSGGILAPFTGYTGQVFYDDDNQISDTSFRLSISIVGYTSFNIGTVATHLDESPFTNGIKYDPANTGMSIGKVEGYSLTEGPYMVDNDVVYTFSFTTGAIGSTITLDDVAIGGTPPWGGAPIGYDTRINGTTIIDMAPATYSVPEPVTVVLLGLGGLLIRRRVAIMAVL